MRKNLTAVFLILLLAGPAEKTQAAPARRTLLALGDSITAGAPAFRSPAEAPPAGRGNVRSQYAYWVEKRHPEWKLVNRGISGQTTENILQRVEAELDLVKPDAVILMAGVNDIYIGYPADQIRRNLLEICNRIRRRGLPVMVLTILPYRGLTPQKFEDLMQTNQWIKDFTRHAGFGFGDTYAAMRQPQDPGQLIRSADGLHPDAEGYRILGEAVSRALESWT